MEMECISRAVLFCTDEPRKRQMPIGVGKTEESATGVSRGVVSSGESP